MILVTSGRPAGRRPGVGATTGLTSGTGFLSLWTPLVGLGVATASAAAILGGVLNATCRGRLDLAGVPAQAAFVHGMDGMLWVCAAIAVAGLAQLEAGLPL